VKKNSKGVYKIWNKIISFDMRKNGKSKTSQKKIEKENEFENPKNESLCFKKGTPLMLEFTYN